MSRKGNNTDKTFMKSIRSIFFKHYCSMKDGISSHINKSIYTRIIGVNVSFFILCIAIFIGFYSISYNSLITEYAEKDLLRKATRSNYALLQQEDWEWLPPSEKEDDTLTEDQKSRIAFLADVFDARITVFDREGNLVATSAEQDVVPGTKVDQKYIDVVMNGETYAGHTTDKDSKERIYVGVVPMGESDEEIENGILLEAQASNLNHGIEKNNFQLILAGALMVMVMILLSLYQAIHLSRPINEITTDLVELKSGQYAHEEKVYQLVELNDLSDQITKLHVEMSRLKEENKAVESERTRLFAETSHELRTPLTAIQGYVEAIRDGVVKDQTILERYMDIIYTQTLHVGRLVDDLLQLSRLESGVISLQRVPLDLVHVIKQTVSSMNSMAKERNTEMHFKEMPSEAIVVGDPDRMQQIIKNLLDNALNATENGNIFLSVHLERSHLICQIEDTGVGISEEDLPRIWDRFYQSYSRKKSMNDRQSSGLGLAIVKQLVELQAGSINASSELGKGTVFTIQFPVTDRSSRIGLEEQDV